MKTFIREKAERAADQGKYIQRRPRLNGKSEKNHDDNVKQKEALSEKQLKSDRGSVYSEYVVEPLTLI